MPLERSPPLTRSRSVQNVSSSSINREKVNENPTIRPSNPSVIESHSTHSSTDLLRSDTLSTGRSNSVLYDPHSQYNQPSLPNRNMHSNCDDLGVDPSATALPSQVLNESSDSNVQREEQASAIAPARVQAVNDVQNVNAETAEQRCERLENELVAVKTSIAALSNNTQRTNELLALLVNAQQVQNVPAAQCNAAQVNSQLPQQNSNFNQPLLNVNQRTSDARGKIRPPNDFNGLPDEAAEIWIDQMQSYLRLSNESPSQWVELASSYLQKDAILWWRSSSNANPLRSQLSISWDEFVDAFLQRFRSIASEEHAMSKLQKWKHTGNLETFINGFTNIQSSISYVMMSEPARIVQFTNNLAPHLQRYVKQCKPTTLQEAIAYVREGADTFRTSNNRAVLQSFGDNRIIHRRSSKRYSLGDSRSQPIQLENAEIDVKEYYKDKNNCEHQDESNSNLNNISHSSELTMLLNALSPEQVQLFKERRCFYCKQKGHQRNECSKLKLINNNKKPNNF